MPPAVAQGIRMVNRLSQIAAIVGAASGVASLLVIVFSVGVRLGDLTARVGVIEGKLIEPQDFGGLKSQVGTLYKIYVEDALKVYRPGNPGHPDENLVELLDAARQYGLTHPDLEATATVIAFVRELAAEQPEYLSAAAKETGVVELLGFLLTAVEESKKDPGALGTKR